MVSGSATAGYPRNSEAPKSPPEHRWSPSWSCVINAKHGKPYAPLRQALRNLIVREGDGAEGRGGWKKRKPLCNGADKAIPALKGG